MYTKIVYYKVPKLVFEISLENINIQQTDSMEGNMLVFTKRFWNVAGFPKFISLKAKASKTLFGPIKLTNPSI